MGRICGFDMITAEMLTIETEALTNDRALYLECLNGKPLTERKTDQEIRDGCLLFWRVYMICRKNS